MLTSSNFGNVLKRMISISNNLGYQIEEFTDVLSSLKNLLLKRLDDENDFFLFLKGHH